MSTVRTITIELRRQDYDDPPESWGASGWWVHEADRYIDGLSWDEMLGQIATLTHPKLDGASLFGGMLTAEEHAARDLLRKERTGINQEAKPPSAEQEPPCSVCGQPEIQTFPHCTRHDCPVIPF